MNYLTLLLMLLFIGCTCKPDLVVEYRDRNMTISEEQFCFYQVEPFVVMDNNKSKWRLHVSKLKMGYDSCSKQMDLLKERYGK